MWPFLPSRVSSLLSLAIPTHLGDFPPGFQLSNFSPLSPVCGLLTVTFIKHKSKQPGSCSGTLSVSPHPIQGPASFKQQLRPSMISPHLTLKLQFQGFCYHSPSALASYIHLTNIKKDCKSKPLWGTISHQSEWLRSKSLQVINVGEGVEKREPSYTVGGNAN